MVKEKKGALNKTEQEDKSPLGFVLAVYLAPIPIFYFILHFSFRFFTLQTYLTFSLAMPHNSNDKVSIRRARAIGTATVNV